MKVWTQEEARIMWGCLDEINMLLWTTAMIGRPVPVEQIMDILVRWAKL